MTTLTAPTPMMITTEELETLESKVRSGLATFVEVGNALMEIRDRGGYKRRGYKTFEEYCSREFGASDRHARRLIVDAETAAKVQKVLGVTPRNDGVARELTKIADDPVVLEKVAKKLDSGKKPLTIATATAERVKEVIASVTGHPLPPKSDHGSGAPKPGASRAAGAVAPAVPADDVATLQATLTAVRSFLAQHPWLKDDAVAKKRIAQLDEGLVLLDKLLAGSFAHVGARPKDSQKPDAGGPPRCPHCKEPIEPGAVFCDKCGSVL